MTKKTKTPVALAKWIWHAYLKTALVPLVVIELVFVGMFFASDSWVQKQMSMNMKESVDDQLSQMASAETTIIENQLQEINENCAMYARQTAGALATTSSLSPTDAARLQYSSDGIYYTASDSGGAAVFYSGYMPIGDVERQKVANILATQDFMRDMYLTHPLIASIYFNTYDSLNVIYPYFDVIAQYQPYMNIPEFNFYYEADQMHNPERTVQWTDVYLDPAGHGWMASCIAPVYNNDFLEGVVGIDVTVSTLTDQILQMSVPWEGYGILVGSDGTILALPNQGEEEWGVTELTNHHYDEAIKQDTFKPEQFNLNKRPDTADLAALLAKQSTGDSALTLGGESKVIAWNTIKETGWKLIIIVPEEHIYEKLNDVGSQLQKLSLLMIGGIILFYAIFFQVLYMRSKKMSRTLSLPLLQYNNAIKCIGDGDYYQEMPDFSVRELDETSKKIVSMGRRLGEVNSNLLTAQEDLRAKESYLQAIIKSIDDAIVELDDSGAILNLFVKEKKSMPVAESLASIDHIFSQDKAALVLKMVKKVIETDCVETIEIEVETFSGLRWVQGRASLVRRDPNRVVITVRDITEHKELEESISKARDAAEAASRAKSQFLSNMSHELRTPLNAVLGFAQVLDMDPSAPLTGMQKECVLEITKAGNHLLELINEVLDLARIESGRERLSIEPVEIMAVIEETLAMIMPTSEKYGIKVSADHLSCRHVFIKADKVKLKQILLNLLSNAIKYNKPNGYVNFYCETVGDKVRFHVVDSGIGIPESELEMIFKPFHRLNNMKNIVEGTGVGLAVVKQLTQMMDGIVHAESEEGVGSHFYIELPAAKEMPAWIDHSNLHENVVKTSRGLPNNLKILYVEDNQANLRLVERLLELIPGTKYLPALSAEEGIDIARIEKPDIILMDINLPGMDGFEAYEKLQEYTETRDIPVIAVSSNAMDKDIGNAMRMGFFDFITKPIETDAFFERLGRVFEKDGNDNQH